MPVNLISVSKFYKDNLIIIEIHDGYVLVKEILMRKLILQGVSKHGLCKF